MSKGNRKQVKGGNAKRRKKTPVKIKDMPAKRGVSGGVIPSSSSQKTSTLGAVTLRKADMLNLGM